MSPSTSTLTLHRVAIVARLRAAGCVFAEDEADLLISSAGTPADLLSMVDRRVDGLPLEHILGWARFCAIRVTVAPGVFVPRVRTELLVRHAVALAGSHEATVVDLCCGSGAVGVAVASSADQIHLYAADIDPASVACARRNLEPFGGRVYQGDLFTPLPGYLRRRVDVLIANAPYVPTGAISLLPPEARLHEPHLALDGGADGLDVLRRLATETPDWLAPRGHLLVETSERQAPAAAEVLDRAGLIPHVVHDEDLDATAVIGHR
jgi:release factor glutamine methyltransferase